MSNTDGEDTQPLLSNLAKLDKIASKEVSRWHEKSNKRLGEQLRDAEKDLASLREQLKLLNDALISMQKQLKKRDEQLKQKEDENRELVNFLLAIPIDPVYWVEYGSLIRKHKKNLSA